MSARPLFDIPEGWRLLTDGDVISKKDCRTRRSSRRFMIQSVDSMAGATVEPEMAFWYFRRIESPTPALAPAFDGAVDLLSGAKDPVYAAALLNAFRESQTQVAALTSRVSVLEAAREKDFRAGFLAGSSFGFNQARDGMGVDDDPDENKAWEEYKSGSGFAVPSAGEGR